MLRMATNFEIPDPDIEGGWFTLEKYRNASTRNLSPDQRIIVDKDDNLFDVIFKWRDKWDAVENNEDDS